MRIETAKTDGDILCFSIGGGRARAVFAAAFHGLEYLTGAALLDFAKKYIPAMEALDPETNDRWNDLHMLFGMLCAVAELQLALPGQLRSAYPLKQVLDRRPFI